MLRDFFPLTCHTARCARELRVKLCCFWLDAIYALLFLLFVPARTLMYVNHCCQLYVQSHLIVLRLFRTWDLSIRRDDVVFGNQQLSGSEEPKRMRQLALPELCSSRRVIELKYSKRNKKKRQTDKIAQCTILYQQDACGATRSLHHQAVPWLCALVYLG